MKLPHSARIQTWDKSHPVRGAWIEIQAPVANVVGLPSHPVRGAWIEIPLCHIRFEFEKSHPVRGAWIEIIPNRRNGKRTQSHPVRGAWIEIRTSWMLLSPAPVAPREGCVD